MQIKDVMTPNVECTEPAATLRQAAQRMRDLDIGLLPVCENDRLAGMVTDRDITVRAVAAGMDPVEARVRDIMTPKVIYCFEDDDISEAARLMRENQVRRIVVLNDQKRLTGILSLGDLAVDVGDEMLAVHTLEAVSEPAAPRR